MNPAATESGASAPARSRPRARTVSAERVLFAFSPREQGIFFPSLRLDHFHACPHVYVDTDRTDAEAWEKTLRDCRPTVIVSAWSTRRIPAAWAASDDFSLRYVCHVAGSLRSVLSRDLLEQGVQATNWGDAISHTVAEHAVLLALALLRGAPRWRASTAEGGWAIEHVTRLRTKSLRGRRIGLHGFGSVARATLPLLAAFQPAEVRVYSHGVPRSLIAEQGAIPCSSLDELFSGSEILIGCESLSPQNRGSVDARILGLLPDDAVFINVGRGPIVDETALLHEAASGRLRIGLDVFHHEPLSPDSPLTHAPGILLSPHIAGPTWDTYRSCGDHALENLRRYLAGESLGGEVTPAGFDRMT